MVLHRPVECTALIRTLAHLVIGKLVSRQCRRRKHYFGAFRSREVWPRAILHPLGVLTNTSLSTKVTSQLTWVPCDEHSFSGEGCSSSNFCPSSLSALKVLSRVTVTHATSPCT